MATQNWYQPLQPNTGAEFIRGLGNDNEQFLNNQQTRKMNEMKMLGEQRKMQQEEAINELTNLAANGDQQAMQKLSMVAPEKAKGAFDYQENQIKVQNQKITRGAQIAQGIVYANPDFQQQRYVDGIAKYAKEYPDEDISFLPKTYNKQVSSYLQQMILEGRKVEDVTKEMAPEYSTEETGSGLTTFNKKTGEFKPAMMGDRNLGVYVKPPTTVVNVGGEQPAFRKKLEETYGTKTAERLDKVNTDAENAVQTKQWLAVQRDALANLPDTGVLDSSKIYLGNLANQLGVTVDMKKISSLEQLSAAGNTITIPLVKQLGYNPTDADARLIGSTISNIGKGKATNLQLNDLIDQAADKQIFKAQIADKLRSEGREPELTQQLRNYDLANPIKMRNLSAQNKNAKTPITSSSIDATAKKYGMTREQVIAKLREKGVM